MDLATLKGLAPAIQFDRLQSALRDEKIGKAEAVALAAQVGMPEDMQLKLEGSKLVGVGYAGTAGNARDRAPVGEIIAEPGQAALSQELALRTGRPIPAAVASEDDEDEDRYEPAMRSERLIASVQQEGVQDLKQGREQYGRGLAACVRDVTNTLPSPAVGAFSGALREATLAALDKAVLARFRSAIGDGFREPVPSFGDWHTYALGSQLRVRDQINHQAFIAGLHQKLEVVDDAQRVLESVFAINGKIKSWTRNNYDEAGQLSRCVTIRLGDMPSIAINEMGDKGFVGALEVRFYDESSGTHVHLTKAANNGEWVQARYDNARKYNLETGFHGRDIAGDYGDTQRLDQVRLVDETPVAPDFYIGGPQSFQDAFVRLFRGDKALPQLGDDKLGERASWDRKVYDFYRNGGNIVGRQMNVYRGDGTNVSIEHPGRGSTKSPGRVELPLSISFERDIVPSLLQKALV